MAGYLTTACYAAVVPPPLYAVNHPAAGKHVSSVLKFPVLLSVPTISTKVAIAFLSLPTSAMVVKIELPVL